MRFFRRFAWFGLIYTLAAVAWGVFVRAGKYGDGCGDHWPICGDTHEPLMGSIARVIEMSHRISSAVCGPIALGLVWLAYRHLPKGHYGRTSAIGVLVMVLIEGAIGAALVRFKLVVDNDSIARAGVMAFHCVATFFLIGFLVGVLQAARGVEIPTLKKQGMVPALLGMGFFGIVMLGISGAVSALAHQLHAVDNVLEAAFMADSHWMVRLQPLHPLIAVSVSLYLVLMVGMLNHLRPSPEVRKAGQMVLWLLGVQIVVGASNIVFDAPIVMQMVHLVLADLNWASLTVLSLAALAVSVERVELRPAPELVAAVEPLRGRGLVKAYVALTKPRVISLLLFTTLTAMVAANAGFPPLWQFFAVAIGGYMSAGAANAINMVIDRDIDVTMKRTATRPTVTQGISSTHALAFAFLLAIGSFVILLWSANLLTAVLALTGLVFYVVVYTMLLKRRTWHNIVIGGAAGAFPPLVGWAAITDSVPPLAIYLFAVVFVWTPVHFWALALMLKDEYAAAGVPMLPCVRGDRYTVKQILAYGVGTVALTCVPFVVPKVGWIYIAATVVLNALLLYKCIDLYRHTDRPRAVSLFHYSMLYLALLFLAFAVSRTVAGGVIA